MYIVMVCFIFMSFEKITILLSISQDTLVTFLKILPSILQDTTGFSLSFILVQDSLSCQILCYVRPTIFKETDRGAKNVSCVAKPIISTIWCVSVILYQVS